MEQVINLRRDGIPLSGFQDRPRWVTWREELRKGKTTKVPYCPLQSEERKAEANAPETWGVYSQAAAHAGVLRGARGVGIVLGQFDDEWCLGGIDLDACRHATTGDLAGWAQDILRMFRTYGEVSPSGTGVKAFFLYRATMMEQFRAFMGDAMHSKIWRRDAATDHGEAIELHFSNRYFTTTGRLVEGLPRDIHRANSEDIFRLLRVIGPAFAKVEQPKPEGQGTFDEAPKGEAPKGNLWDRIRDRASFNPVLMRLLSGDFSTLNDRSRSAKAMALGGALARAGFSREDVFEALHTWPETAEWAREKGDASNAREFERLWEKASAKDSEARQETPRPEPDKSPLPLVYFLDAQPNLDTADFVEGLLTSTGMSVVYGESNCGKTFFATDLALHVSMGKKWRDREIERGGVIYCALEGSHGILNRVAAFRQHYKLDGVELPFAVIPVTLNLLDPDADTSRLIEAIAHASAQMDVPVKMVVLDTLSRAMAGGNENAPDDMGALVANDARIRQVADVHVMWIHHSGKDAAKGARGHSLLRAATDTEIEIARENADAPSIATVKKQRDMEIDGEWAFRLETVELGKNRRGKPVTSCVVTSTEQPEATKSKVTLSGDQQMALRVLHDTLAEAGEMGFPGAPPNIPSIPEDWWRDRYYSRVKPGADASTKRKSFRRAADTLVEFRLAAANKGRVWAV